LGLLYVTQGHGYVPLEVTQKPIDFSGQRSRSQLDRGLDHDLLAVAILIIHISIVIKDKSY